LISHINADIWLDFLKVELINSSPKGNQMEDKIIEDYKKTGSCLATSEKFRFAGWSYNKVIRLLRQRKVIKKPGNFYGSEQPLQVDNSREFRYLTDKDLNFENEIKTKIF